MSKGSKEALTVLIVTHVTHVKRVESSVCGFFLRVHNIFTHNFLNIQRIFNPKKFWKAESETFPTIPFNAMYVERVESYFDFQPLWHASTYIALAGMVGKVSVSAFQNFFRIENLLNIKKVMSKTVKASFYPFDMSNMSNN